ncbi:23155_t:CDS:10 [Cetraspora pellucida]|uniref:23155_t:CDS:1 n=1 Tax=Cetraspora pellucida TaxID=1433469 RepID=A0A9N8WJ46_9GLOM|nr:23155_t:CDS:10 [Cetraspora pellucida]
MELEPENVFEPDNALEPEPDYALKPDYMLESNYMLEPDYVLEPVDIDLDKLKSNNMDVNEDNEDLLQFSTLSQTAAFIVEELQLFSITQSQAFKRIIEELDIQANSFKFKHITVSDTVNNESNIMLCLEKLEKKYGIFKIHCFGHTLQLAINDVLKECLEITNLIKRYKDVVFHFSRSPKQKQFLLKVQIEMNDWNNFLFVVHDVLTRWNLTYYLLKRLTILKPAIYRYKSFLVEVNDNTKLCESIGDIKEFSDTPQAETSFNTSTNILIFNIPEIVNPQSAKNIIRLSTTDYIKKGKNVSPASSITNMTQDLFDSITNESSVALSLVSTDISLPPEIIYTKSVDDKSKLVSEIIKLVNNKVEPKISLDLLANNKLKNSNEEFNTQLKTYLLEYIPQEKRETHLRQKAIELGEDPNKFIIITEKNKLNSIAFRDRMQTDTRMCSYAKKTEKNPSEYMDMTMQKRLISEEIIHHSLEENKITLLWLDTDKEWKKTISILQANGNCRIAITKLPKSLEEEIVRKKAKQILQNRYRFSEDQVNALFTILKNKSRHSITISDKNVNIVIANQLSKEMEKETIEDMVTKFPDITEDANKIQNVNQKKAEAKCIDYPDKFTLESVKERLNAYNIKTLPDCQTLANIIIMLCIPSAKLKTLCITDTGVTGYVKNRGQPDISRKFRSIEKNQEQAKELLTWIQHTISSGRIGAVYSVVVHEAKNMAHAYTIAEEFFIETLVEGKIPVKALIDTSSKFNTISKSLFDKLEEDYGLECLSDNKLIGEEIKCLDLQFYYKGKWQSLDSTEMHKAKISFGYSPKTYDSYAKIVINSMSILLIKENSNKDSFTKNSSPNSNPSLKNIENIIRFIIYAVEKGTSYHIISNFYKYQYCHTSSYEKKKKNGKAKVARTISVSELESSISDSSNSSTSYLEIEVTYAHKTRALVSLIQISSHYRAKPMTL